MASSKKPATNSSDDEALRTDSPLSEKDEVKQAEQRTVKSAQEQKTPGGSDVKNRQAHSDPKQHK